MYTVLVCDDEKDILQALNIYLSAEGYHILTATNGQEALDVLRKEQVHLILMDIMMPMVDGMTALTRIRELSSTSATAANVPVILLTAKSEDTDKIMGLTVGADDYITKPFQPLEVLARVKAQLRRYAFLGGMTKERQTTLLVGGIALDDESKSVTLDGEPVSLTPTEYAILRLLMRNPGKVFSSREISRHLLEEANLGAESSVAVHIRHLREKLEIDPADPRYLKVVWGQGYKMEAKLCRSGND